MPRPRRSKTTFIRHIPDTGAPAGCLKGDVRRSGDEIVDRLAGPEEKAAMTRGQVLVGNITMPQYLALVEHGYDGDVVKRWTCYRADQEIRRKNLAVRETVEQGFDEHAAVKHDQLVKSFREELRVRRAKQKAQREERQRSMPRCPLCSARLADLAKLQKHVAKVHQRKRGQLAKRAGTDRGGSNDATVSRPAR